MVKCVSILGSTGSIGRQSLDIISRLDDVSVVALTAGTSVERMAQQCREFQPELAVMATQEAAQALAEEIKDLPTRVSWGEEGLIEAATIPSAARFAPSGSSPKGSTQPSDSMVCTTFR